MPDHHCYYQKGSSQKNSYIISKVLCEVVFIAFLGTIFYFNYENFIPNQINYTNNLVGYLSISSVIIIPIAVNGNKMQSATDKSYPYKVAYTIRLWCD